MKTLICTCKQCRAQRKYSSIPKGSRTQTYEVRAAKSHNRQILRTAHPDDIEDLLAQKCKVDYYA